MNVLQTNRLVLRRLNHGDAEFIVQLLNEPAFLDNIGDKGVRTVADAEAYVDQGPAASYEEHGFGLYLVSLRENEVPIGICGLLKRDTLEDVDLGFALLPEFRSRGYATEAAEAVVARADTVHGLDRLVAITTPANGTSKRVLGRLGFEFERMVQLSDEDDEICLYSRRRRGKGD